jgi:MSHA pilin protein MshA
MKKQQRGFTLIELVIVIVILGILAVTAAPKFLDISGDAKAATLQGVKASLQTIATVTYSKSLIAGEDKNEGSGVDTTEGTDGTIGDDPVVSINGLAIEVNYGYPESFAGTATTNGGQVYGLLDVDATEFLQTTVAAAGDITALGGPAVAANHGTVVIYPKGYIAPANGVAAATNDNDQCFVYYQNSLTAAGKPLIGVSTDDC